MSNITSNDIAAKFYAQGLSNRWLSRKQTSWLFETFQREVFAMERREHISHTRLGHHATGNIFENGEPIATWDIYVNPNGCGVFKVTPIAEQKQDSTPSTDDYIAHLRANGATDEQIELFKRFVGAGN